MPPMESSQPAAARLPDIVRGRRSAWTQAGLALLAGSGWVAYRVERRIFHDTRTVTVITNVHSEAERAEARRTRDPRDDIAEIYGVPIGSPIDLVISGRGAKSRCIAPVEAPDRRFVDRRDLPRLDTPIAARIKGHALSLGVALGGGAALLVARWRRGRNPPATPMP